MNMERLKSLLIVALLLSSIGMTGIYMQGYEVADELNRASLISFPASEKTIYDVLSPQLFTVNFGGNVYSAHFLPKQTEYELLLKWLEDLEGSALERLPYESIQTFEESPYMRYSMPSSFPLSLLLNSAIENLDAYTFTGIIITQNGELYFEEEDGLLRLNHEGEPFPIEERLEVLQPLVTTKFDTIEHKYYDAASFDQLGLEYEKNSTLVPVGSLPSLPTYQGLRTFNPNYESTFQPHVTKIFGSDVSFLKKLVQNDNSVLYMLGYGDVILKFSSEGTLELTRKVENPAAKSLKKALVAAIDAIDHIEGEPAVALVAYEELADGYNFYFTQLLNGHYLRLLDAPKYASIRITTKGNQVATYESERFDILPMEEDQESGLTFLQLIENNFDTIVRAYQEDRPAIPTTAVNAFFNELTAFEYTYVVGQAPGDQEMIPAWRMVIADTRYLLNAQNGEILEMRKTYGLE